MQRVFLRFTCCLLCFSIVPFGPAYSLPVIDSAGADVSVVEDVSVMTITEGDKTIINYSDFSIGSAETLQFVQPSSTAVALCCCR